MLATKSSALIFSPHQDDESLGCGGLIAQKRILGADVCVVFITDGSRGCSDDSLVLPHELAETRRLEAIRALDVLGVPTTSIIFLGFQDGSLSSMGVDKELEAVSMIKELVQTLKPAEVFIPYRNDSHADHRGTYKLVLEALSCLKLKPNLFQYLIWALEYPWRAGFCLNDFKALRYVNIADHLFLKNSAIGSYRSQIEPQPPAGRIQLPEKFLRLFSSRRELYFFTKS